MVKAGGDDAFSFLPSEGGDETLPAATLRELGKKVSLLYGVQGPALERTHRLTTRKLC